MNTLLEEPRTLSISEEWTQALGVLEQQLTEWSEAEGWQVRAAEQTLTEDSTGSYRASDLTITTPQGETILVEVKGRGPVQGSGKVQIMAWPTLYRVMLLHKPGASGWVIRTDSGIPVHQPWNQKTFITLARDLLGAEYE